MTKRPLRVVETPEDLDFDLHIDIAELDTDAEGPPLEDEATAIERRRREACALVNKLSPSAFALHLHMQRALEKHADEIATRLDGDPHHLVIACRVPTYEWYDVAKHAAGAVVALLVADHPAIGTETAHSIPDYDRTIGTDTLPLARILGRAKRMHVVACYAETKHLPGLLGPFADASIDLSIVERNDFARAIDRAFGVTETDLDRIDVSDLEPDLFDHVVGRAPNAAAVPELLQVILRERAVAKLHAENEDEKKEKKSTASRVYVPLVTRPTSPTLSELYGYDTAQIWGTSLAEDLADYAAGRLSWHDVDGGALLYGPPGTGKTLFASALAATCGLPFIATSYAQWQAAGDGHLGFVVKAIRAVFEKAEGVAPCIVFIDEIDTVRGRGRAGDQDGWWTAVTTALLECLDGTSRREGVVIIAACNHPEVLDPALVRSGRLDRRFEIGLPDEEALLRIFAHHLPGADVEQLAPAATVLAGSTSGADVARIAREARRAARREKRDVVAADLLAIAIPPEDRSPEHVRLIAVHEAGHAVAMMSGGSLPECMSLVRSGVTGGHVRSSDIRGIHRLGALEHEVAVLLAGRAAEEVVLGEPSAGAAGDLQAATAAVSQIVGTLGLGGRLSYASSVDVHAVEARLQELYGRALRLVAQHRPAVEALADLAFERRVLGRRALAEFAAANGFEVRS